MYSQLTRLGQCVGSTGLYNGGENKLYTDAVYLDVICFAAEKPMRLHNGKQTPVEKGLRESWEPSIHLDGRPVDRFVISSSKPTRSHRFTKAGKDSRSHLLEDVGKAEPEKRSETGG